jgi:small subunit ribosomal protein S1
VPPGTQAPAPDAAVPQPGAPAKAADFSAETQAEIDAAMAVLEMGGATTPARGGRGKKPREQQRSEPVEAKPQVTPVGGLRQAIRGPRVVQAGREHRTGTLVSVGPTDLFLEFGPKELGVAARAQWPDDQLPKVGEPIEVVIDRYEPAESIYVCSRPGAVVKAAWEMLEVGTVVEARVVGVNKGGLELEVANHRAFMPASQASLERVEDLSTLIGEKFPCVVAQVDRRGKGNIVLSRRDLLEQERKTKAEKLRAELKEGDVVDGVVRKIMPFGAFVDIGGIDGLVHMSDLTYDRVNYGENAVAKHVKVGQQVKVKVLKLEWDNNRLSLGMKQLAGDPFATATQTITEGADVSGRVTRLAEFGAFLEVAPGVEGLVHISEIAHRRIGSPGDVLKVDQVVTAKVLKVDPDGRKISLSIKATQPAPEVPGRKGDSGPKRTAEEIMKESPALRRLRENFAKQKGKQGFKGGLS